MNNFEDIRNELWDVNVDDLKKFCTRIGVAKKGCKSDIIDSIMNIYRDSFVKDTYDLLNEYEKALIDNYIQQKRNPVSSTIDEINSKYKKKKLDITSNYYRYFVPYGYKRYHMTNSIYNQLVDIVPKMVITFTETNFEDIENYYGYICDRGNRVGDFDYFIKYLNANKVKPTSKNRCISKRDLNKIFNDLNYSDILRNPEFLTVKDVKKIDDTSISYGIFKLLVAGHVINDTKEYFELGSLSDSFVKLNKVEKIKFLLDKYINCSSIYINEIERIKTALIKTETVPDLVEARKYLVEMLKKLPINKWVSGNEFKVKIRMDNYRFIRNNLRSCLVRDDYYNSYYDSPNFEQLEESFIDIFLIEYMASLGIVDVVVNNFDVGDWNQRITNITEFLRLTEFGAIVLGILEDNSKQEEDLGFDIDKNFNILIFDGCKKMEYELYFERFLNKDSKGTYLLDFSGIARALDLGISLSEIIEYIKVYGKNIDKSVIDTLKIWLVNSKKIKIRNVTIVEYPSELSDLFNRNSINNNIEKTNKEYLIVQKSKVNNLKNEIEKKGFYCDIKN